MKTITTNLTERKLAEFITGKGALAYTPEMVGHKSGLTDEIRKIDEFLNRADNCASQFMVDGGKEELFLDEVSYHSAKELPVIIRAIQISLQNRY